VQIQDLQHKMLGVLQIGHVDKLPAKNGKSNLLRKYIDCCFFKILSCHSVYLSHAILSRRSFVAALFCCGALLSLRSFVAALMLRLSFFARSFVARSNVVDSLAVICRRVAPTYCRRIKEGGRYIFTFLSAR
jgi:hypothetical protein